MNPTALFQPTVPRTRTKKHTGEDLLLRDKSRKQVGLQNHAVVGLLDLVPSPLNSQKPNTLASLWDFKAVSLPQIPQALQTGWWLIAQPLRQPPGPQTCSKRKWATVLQPFFLNFMGKFEERITGSHISVCLWLKPQCSTAGNKSEATFSSPSGLCLPHNWFRIRRKKGK